MSGVHGMGDGRSHLIDLLIDELGFKLEVEHKKTFIDKILMRKGEQKVWYKNSGISVNADNGIWYNNGKELGRLFDIFVHNTNNVKMMVKQMIRQNKLERIQNENKTRFRK